MEKRTPIFRAPLFLIVLTTIATGKEPTLESKDTVQPLKTQKPKPACDDRFGS